MRPFEYERAGSLADASGMMGDAASIIAGGTNLMDLMKIQVMTPSRVIDISRLPATDPIQTHGDRRRPCPTWTGSKRMVTGCASARW